MAFIGNTVQTQGFTPAIDYFNGNGVTVTFTLSRPVASVAQMIVAIDNVIQNPSSAFNVSGNSITFTSAPLSGTNNIWVEYTSLITTYQGISQDPSVIGDITATGGFLSTGDFGNSFIDGAVIDYVTGAGRITVGELDNLIFYHGGTAGRSEMMKLSYAGTSTLEGGLTISGAATIQGLTVGKGGGSVSSATVVGNGAMAATNTGVYNSAFGNNASNSNTSGAYNSSFGAAALYNNSTGSYNTAIGMWALQANTTSDNNTAVGYQALYTGATSGNCTAVGTSALYKNTGAYNTAVGMNAMYNNTSSVDNTAVGYQALYYSTTAIANTAVGRNCMLNATSGSYNVALGYSAGYAVTTGEQNVIIGYSAGNYTGYGGVNLTTGVNNVIIGPYTAAASAAAQYSITIGYGAVSQGDNYVSLGKNSNIVYNQFTSNASWTRSSDERLKRNINNSSLGLEFISKLRPVTYQWKPSYDIPKELTDQYNEENNKDTEVVMHGLIAQEVKAALDEAGVNNFGGWHLQKDGTQGVSTEMFVFPLINAVKEQQELIKSLTARIAALEAK